MQKKFSIFILNNYNTSNTAINTTVALIYSYFLVLKHFLIEKMSYSRFTIELREVFLAMKVFKEKNVSFLFKMTINSLN